MKKYRFCMVSTFYPPFSFGGDGVFVRRLATALAERDHEVHVIHDRDAFEVLTSASVERLEYRDHANVHHHPIRRRGIPIIDLTASHQLGRPFGQAESMRGLLAEIDPEIIHFHNISLLGGPGTLAMGSGVKLCTLHDYWWICPTHALWRYDREACTRRTCLRCTLRERRPPQVWRYSALMSRSARYVDFFLSPSRFALDTHRQNGLTGEIRRLPHFAKPVVNPGASTHQQSRERPYFLFVGRLEKLKGAQDLIAAFRHFKEADLWIVGKGGYEERLRQQAAGLENVRFEGWVGQVRLQELTIGSTAVLIPSLCYETFCLVAVEAFAVRTPVISRKIGALAEIGEQGRGILYESEEELVAAMRSLLEDPQKQEHFAEAGYQAYRQDYSEEVHMDRYLELIAEAMARHKRGRPHE